MPKVWEEIKDRLKLEDVIMEYLPLKPAGRNLRANCPFHHEKTPSFMVSPERGIWHCFGCGEGGDIFKFVQKIEGIEFADSLKILAKKAGVELKREDPRITSKRTRLVDILDLASGFYHDALYKTSQGKTALKYLESRGVSGLIVDLWKLGFAPDSWNSILDFLKLKGFGEQEIYEAGLSLKKENRNEFYDRFRARIMFPIRDSHGLVVGFGGRLIHEKPNEGKYINSPQTLAYNKSEILFGLDKAKDEIRQKKFAILVEGYMDLIACFEAGTKNVVASSGTALTFGQLKLLKRYTDNLALAFDYDLAGELALKRSVETAFELGFNVEVIKIEGAKDPDELIRKNKQAWLKAVDDRISVIEHFVRKKMGSDMNIASGRAKKEAIDDLAPLLQRIADPIEKAHYVEMLASRLGVPSSAVNEKLRQHKVAAPSQTRDVQQEKTADNFKNLSKHDKMAERLFSLCLLFPHYWDEINAEWWPNHEMVELWDELKSNGVDEFLKMKDVLPQRLIFLKETQEQGMSIRELEEEFFKARAFLWQNYLRVRQEKIKDEMKSQKNNGMDDAANLLLELKKINEELYKAQTLD